MEPNMVPVTGLGACVFAALESSAPEYDLCTWPRSIGSPGFRSPDCANTQTRLNPSKSNTARAGAAQTSRVDTCFAAIHLHFIAIHCITLHLIGII
jgi:hypothetical protein